LNGVISIIKPPGMTSHDVVAYLRKLLGIKRIGHTGTLDPGAAGVLPVCIGKATRLSEFITDETKVYLCEMVLGVETDTLDSYGKDCIRQHQIEYPPLENHTPRFSMNLGESLHKYPPAYSASKIQREKII
jgi:tRNA pseudouridine55 synthase